MHYLHPRSRSTSTLFTTTLAVSFIIVGLPHVLPCPADRRQFADSYETTDGKVRRRRKGIEANNANAGPENSQVNTDAKVGDDGLPKRECPVPKPRGIVGQVLGFGNEKRPKPTEVVVQALETRQSRQTRKHSSSET